MTTATKVFSVSQPLNADLTEECNLKSLKTRFPLVSIIIPVYNGAKYIVAAIDSIFRQTYGNYEIIVVDDGSTDDTRDRLKVYEDKIRYIYQANEGSASARNLGIDIAKGELIAFLDADDYWITTDKLAKQIACFQENPNLGCVNTGWQIVDADNKLIKTVHPWQNSPQLDLETWLKNKCVRTSAMMFRREWLEKVNGFDKELRQSQDVDLMLRLSLAGCQTVWLKEETVGYRQHDRNTTKNNLQQVRYVEAVLDKFFGHHDLPPKIRALESQTRYHTLVWLAWYQYRANNLEKMSELLERSLDTSPYLRVENIAHWLISFERFSLERGEDFNANHLIQSDYWQALSLSILGIEAQSQSDKPDLVVKSQSQNESSINSREENTQAILSQTKDTKVIAVSSPKPSQEIKEVNPELAKKYSISGDALLAQGHKREAIDSYQMAITMNPNLLGVHYKLASFLLESGDLDGAISSCKNVLRLKPEDKEILEKLADALFQRGNEDDISQAIDYYKQVLKIKPNDLNLYFKIIEIDSLNLETYVVLGEKLVNSNQLVLAVNLLQIARTAFPEDKQIASLLETALNRQRENSHIDCKNVFKANCDRALELSLTSAISLFQIGISLKKEKKITEAGICFEQAIALQPDRYNFYHELSNVYREQKKFESAITTAQKAIELKPDFVWAHHNLGRCYEGIKSTDKAIEAYQNALEVQADLKVSLEALDRLLNQQQKHEVTQYQKLAKEKSKAGDMAGAKLVYEKAISLQPNNHDLHHNLGDILRKLGDLDGAISEAKQTIKIRPDFYWGHHNLGRALELKGLKEEAIDAYHSALKIKPDLAESKKNLEKLLDK